MKLSIETLREITLGAVEIAETEKGIAFYRFTKEQRDVSVDTLFKKLQKRKYYRSVV